MALCLLTCVIVTVSPEQNTYARKAKKKQEKANIENFFSYLGKKTQEFLWHHFGAYVSHTSIKAAGIWYLGLLLTGVILQVL